MKFHTRPIDPLYHRENPQKPLNFSLHVKKKIRIHYLTNQYRSSKGLIEDGNRFNNML
ncbi:hypothetical protein BH23THE1_BH23THE1_25670 [soil metagenome]